MSEPAESLTVGEWSRELSRRDSVEIGALACLSVAIFVSPYLVALGPGSVLLAHLRPSFGTRVGIATGGFALGIAGVVATMHLFARRWLARQGGARLERERIVFLKSGGRKADALDPTPRPTLTLAWSEVLGYRDDDPHRVQIVTKGFLYRRVWSHWVTIPTADATERAAALAFLDARGIPRLER